MTKLPLELLKHILDECIFLEVNSVDLDHEDLIEDDILKRVFIRSLEIIGEASKSIPDDFKMNNPDLPC